MAFYGLLAYFMEELVLLANPIKRRLLIHSIVYRETQEDDGWGNLFKTPQVINQVRVEPKTKLVRSGTGESVESTTTIFWDVVFSTPITFVKGSKITFNTKEMELRQVDEVYDGEKLHHLELRLI